MKIGTVLILLSLFMLVQGCEVKTKPASLNFNGNSSFYDLKALSITGDTVRFDQFKGKKVLIVNTASRCGFTPQFEDLQKLHEKYGNSIAILGFPCNQFGDQEPTSGQEILAFCKKNYGVTFQMFEKINVKGDNQHPVYTWLSKKEYNGWNNEEPTWNFCKYLINEEGMLVNYFASGVSPFRKEITEGLEQNKY